MDKKINNLIWELCDDEDFSITLREHIKDLLREEGAKAERERTDTVIKIGIDSFNGQDYTDLEIWEDMQEPLKRHLKEHKEVYNHEKQKR